MVMEIGLKKISPLYIYGKKRNRKVQISGKYLDIQIALGKFGLALLREATPKDFAKLVYVSHSFFVIQTIIIMLGLYFDFDFQHHFVYLGKPWYNWY